MENAAKTVEKKQREFVPLVENKDLPAAPRIHLKAEEILASVDKRVEIHGWCHRVRIQSQKLAFLMIRDGHGYV